MTINLTALLVLAVCAVALASDSCTLKPQTGPCKALITKWFFNQNTQQCDTFIWGGCNGVVPFDTKRDCLAAKCGKPLCDLTPEDVLPPPGTITCAAAFTSWYFNPNKGVCESFFYSACSQLGPFTSLRQCERANCKCKLRPDDADPGSEFTCQAFWTSWFYNARTRGCDKFSYSGCSLIAFSTENECEDKCS